MNSDFNNAKSFVSFLIKQKCIIPEIFITKYYNLTNDNFVSLSDCIDWLNVTRDNIMRTFTAGTLLNDTIYKNSVFINFMFSYIS
jgi:hypothetical protein